MVSSKQLIERLEKITNKKVILKEYVIPTNACLYVTGKVNPGEGEMVESDFERLCYRLKSMFNQHRINLIKNETKTGEVYGGRGFGPGHTRPTGGDTNFIGQISISDLEPNNPNWNKIYDTAVKEIGDYGLEISLDSE